MKYKNIIFDFDGVLAESVHIKTQAFYSMYVRYGEEIADQVVIHHKENGGMSRYEKFPYYHKTFLDIDLSKKDVQILSADFSKLVIDSVVDADEVSGALWFLKKYQKECNYWIASATPTDEINEIVYRRGMSEYFIKIYGSPESKSSIVKKIINKTGLIIDETVFLGDATSDYNAAMNNNIDFMLRQTDENQSLFNKYNDITRFDDYHEIETSLEGIN
jgi:phosphoglycolate phosphatase-like HAD superfamily hydrolase